VLGDTLGNRYLLSGLLGVGGMAEVFLAHDRILGRDLALKTDAITSRWSTCPAVASRTSS
jgi:hypothetical protein